MDCENCRQLTIVVLHDTGPRSSHTSDINMGTLVATLLGAWHYRVSAGTDWPDTSILWLGEICWLYLNVAARTIVSEDPPLAYTSMLLRR